LAGGIGITAIIPFARQVVTGNHNQIHFIWIVHSQDEVTALRPHLLQCQHPSLRLSIYVTSSCTFDKPKAPLQHQPWADWDMTWGQGRPVVADLLAQDASTAGSMAVVCCGPGGLIDDVRASCVALLPTKKETLDFFSGM
jgi:ferredoxin-NADP reductase